jgi:hypothetical protein
MLRHEIAKIKRVHAEELLVMQVTRTVSCTHGRGGLRVRQRPKVYNLPYNLQKSSHPAGKSYKDHLSRDNLVFLLIIFVSGRCVCQPTSPHQ